MPASMLPLPSCRRPMPENMNPSQREAICHFRGPCEVIAGPGSGKTFVLVERILHLIDSCGVSPSGILVLTFSKAAAQEMQARYLRKLRDLSRKSSSSNHLLLHKTPLPLPSGPFIPSFSTFFRIPPPSIFPFSMTPANEPFCARFFSSIIGVIPNQMSWRTFLH